MKISKQTQRRTIILATAVALVALFHIAHFTVQLFYSTNPYMGIKNHTFIGELDTPYQPLNIDDDNQDFVITIQSDEEGNPLVEARPSSMILYSKNPNYVRPDHYGWAWNNVVTYVTLALFVAIVVMVAWLMISAIRGFKTGNIFKMSHPRMLRWTALLVFLYYFFNKNREVFRQLAVGELYGDAMPFDMYSALTISTECLIAPLLLLIFAELMAVAARINEEETMTI